MGQNSEQLREIRDLAEIPDLSFYFFIAITAVVILFVGTVAYMFWQNYRKKRNTRLRRAVFKKLVSVDFSNPKKAAYAITRYGRFLADEERSKKLFDQLLPRLEKYKYTPDPPPFDPEDIKYYDLFVESVNE